VTVFTPLLDELIGRVPGARAAALVDQDGECIDYAGGLPPFDIKLAAAHWQIVLDQMMNVSQFAQLRQIVVRGASRSFVVRALDESYALVLVMARGAGFASCARAFGVFARALQAEAGIGLPPNGPAWRPVRVETGVRMRPTRVGGTAAAPLHPLEVLGAVVGLRRGERGYRVRVATGLETTVVREPGGAWYAEDAIE
jgi:predicted regulator of Ras-like GTPase activity (Roadblock/LC7/MglB family)